MTTTRKAANKPANIFYRRSDDGHYRRQCTACVNVTRRAGEKARRARYKEATAGLHVAAS